MARYDSGAGSLWLVPALNDAPLYLGCHEVGNVTGDLGGITLQYCPDPNDAKGFVVDGSTRDAPSAPTFDITTVIGPNPDPLETLFRNTVHFVLNKVTSGPRDDFANTERYFLFPNARATNQTLNDLLARDPDAVAASTQGWSFTSSDVVRGYPLSSSRVTLAATQNVAAVGFFNAPREETATQTARLACEDGVIAAAPAAAASAKLYITDDGGSTFAVTTADPFAADEAVSGVGMFDFGGTVRILAARGSTDAGSPAEVAYSDDDGATWATVNVGSTNGEFVTSLYVLNAYSIWAGTDGGRIYQSEDGGTTWAVVENAAITTDPINAIALVDANNGYAVSDAGVVLRTTNAGSASPSFSAATVLSGTPDLDAVAVQTPLRAWVGSAAGRLYYTEDGGTTWYERGITGSGTGTIDAIAFDPDTEGLVGYVLKNSAAPVGTLLRTRNGGATWETISVPLNAGLRGLYLCDLNNLFLVGDVSGGTGVLIEVSPSS